MELLKKKIVAKPLVLRVENNKTFEVADFDIEVFLNKLNMLKKKKTKVVDPIKIQKVEEVDLLETVPAHLFEAEEAKEFSAKDGITSEYLNINTPYRGLLLYHGLGAGKACASVAVVESANSKLVHVLTPQGQFFKDQIRKCGGDIDKVRFSAFAMDASTNPFENGVVVIDEVHRFDIEDPKVRRVYEWIVTTPCRVVALSSLPVKQNQLGAVLNMVRGRVKMFRVEKDWGEFAATVQSYKELDGARVLVRNPPGYVNVVEEGKIVGVKRGDFMSDSEFEEKTGATVSMVDPFPHDFSKLSEEGFKKRACGLVAFLPMNPGKVNPVVIHLVKGSKSKTVAANLGKRSLVYTQGFKDFKEELEKLGYLPLGKKIVPKTYVEYDLDEEGEKKRLLFQKSKIPIMLSSFPEVDVDVSEVHMAGVEHFEQLCSRKNEVTPHVYLTSNVDAKVKEVDFEAKTPDEEKFKTYRALKEDAMKWGECLREVAIDCNLHGMRCYHK